MFSMLVHLNAISVTFEGQSRIDLAACEARRTAPRWATFVAKVVDATSSGVFFRIRYTATFDFNTQLKTE